MRPSIRIQLTPGNILSFLLFVCVFLIAFNRIQDLDAWIHLSMGRLLVSQGGFPQLEPFVYPSADQPFQYSSWLFGVLSYLSWKIAPLAGPVLLKTLAAALAFLLVFRTALLPKNNVLIAAILVMGAALVTQERFNLRPEIFQMIFLAASILCLTSWLYSNNRRALYPLPVIHMLWANSHSSITLMFIPFGAFIAGGVIQMLLARRFTLHEQTPPMNADRLMALGIAFAASFLASLISPYGLGQYEFALRFLDSSGLYAATITELRPPQEMRRTVLIAINIFIGASFVLNYRRFSVIFLLLVIPFMYLPLTAIRFTFIGAFVGAPVAARNISEALQTWWKRGGDSNRLRHAVSMAAGVVMIVLCALSLGRVEPFGVWYKQFGTGYDLALQPDGEVQYMDRNNIQGRILNDFGLGQYLAWTGWPRRSIFVDGRSTVSDDLYRELLQYRFSNTMLNDLYRRYGFEVIIMEYPRDPNINLNQPSTLFRHPDWVLVYWDNPAAMFVRRDGPYAHLARRDGFELVYPEMTPEYFRDRYVPSLVAKDREKLLEELQRAQREMPSDRVDVFLIEYQRAMSTIGERTYYAGADAFKRGDYETAERLFRESIAVAPLNINPLLLLARTLGAEGKYAEAERELRTLLSMSTDTPEAFYLLGKSLMEQGKNDDAYAMLNRYVKRFPRDAFVPQARSLIAQIESRK